MATFKKCSYNFFCYQRKKFALSLQARFAHGIDFGIAGDDVGEVRLQRRLHGEIVGARVGPALRMQWRRSQGCDCEPDTKED